MPTLINLYNKPEEERIVNTFTRFLYDLKQYSEDVKEASSFAIIGYTDFIECVKYPMEMNPCEYGELDHEYAIDNKFMPDNSTNSLTTYLHIGCNKYLIVEYHYY